MIQVVDYGTSNIGSILNMFKKVGADSMPCSDPEELAKAKKILLPGVGAFDACADGLRRDGLDVSLLNAVQNGARLLGICVGMQLLFERSEEGQQPGLCLIPGHVARFNFEGEEKLRVPHMGWNRIRCGGEEIFSELEDSKFYFAHSYHAVCEKKFQKANCEYGYDFTCAVQNERVWGVQFHPEKSHKYGMKLFSNFAGLE